MMRKEHRILTSMQESLLTMQETVTRFLLYRKAISCKVKKGTYRLVSAFAFVDSIMKLKDTGLSVQDIKDKVNKYMIETYERFDFLAETAEGMYLFLNSYTISRLFCSVNIFLQKVAFSCFFCFFQSVHEN